MAFRKFRRPFRRMPKRRVAWANGTYEAGIDETGGINEFVMYDPATTDPTVETQGNLSIRVRRIVHRGGMSWTSGESASPVFQGASVHAVCFITDTDDVDNTILVGGQSTILGSSRILWRDCYPITPHNVFTDGVPQGLQVDALKIDFDLKGSWRVRPDDLIILALQMSDDLSVLGGFIYHSQVGVVFEPA